MRMIKYLNKEIIKINQPEVIATRIDYEIEKEDMESLRDLNSTLEPVKLGLYKEENLIDLVIDSSLNNGTNIVQGGYTFDGKATLNVFMVDKGMELILAQLGGLV